MATASWPPHLRHGGSGCRCHRRRRLVGPRALKQPAPLPPRLSRLLQNLADQAALLAQLRLALGSCREGRTARGRVGQLTLGRGSNTQPPQLLEGWVMQRAGPSGSPTRMRPPHVMAVGPSPSLRLPGDLSNSAPAAAAASPPCLPPVPAMALAWPSAHPSATPSWHGCLNQGCRRQVKQVQGWWLKWSTGKYSYSQAPSPLLPNDRAARAAGPTCRQAGQRPQP